MVPCVLLAATACASGGIESGLAAWPNGREGEARARWEPLAQAGDAQAQLYLGVLLETPNRGAPDPVGAAFWYRKAAEQGLSEAQYRLGLMYELGAGVDRDTAQVEYWYGRANRAGRLPGRADRWHGGPAKSLTPRSVPD